MERNVLGKTSWLWGAGILIAGSLDVEASDNIVFDIGIVEDVGDQTVFTDRDNRFETNRYIGTTGRSYVWDNRRLDREGWVAAGQYTQGIWR